MEWKKRKPNGYKKSLVFTNNHDIWLKKYKKLLNTRLLRQKRSKKYVYSKI